MDLCALNLNLLCIEIRTEVVLSFIVGLGLYLAKKIISMCISYEYYFI